MLSCCPVVPVIVEFREREGVHDIRRRKPASARRQHAIRHVAKVIRMMRIRVDDEPAPFAFAVLSSGRGYRGAPGLR